MKIVANAIDGNVHLLAYIVNSVVYFGAKGTYNYREERLGKDFQCELCWLFQHGILIHSRKR